MSSEPKTPLPQRLRTQADMIHLGEKIAWGSETALMDEAAVALDTTMHRLEEAEAALASSADWSAQLRGDIDRLLARNAVLERAMVEAVVPLEALLMSGCDEMHGPEIREAIRLGVEAVRAALEDGAS